MHANIMESTNVSESPRWKINVFLSLRLNLTQVVSTANVFRKERFQGLLCHSYYNISVTEYEQAMNKIRR